MGIDNDLLPSMSEQLEILSVVDENDSQNNNNAEIALKIKSLAKVVFPIIGAITSDYIVSRFMNDVGMTDFTKMYTFFFSSVVGAMTGFVAASEMAEHQ